MHGTEVTSEPLCDKGKGSSMMSDTPLDFGSYHPPSVPLVCDAQLDVSSEDYQLMQDAAARMKATMLRCEVLADEFERLCVDLKMAYLTQTKDIL